MAELLGIENLKKLIQAGLAIPKQIAESSADGWQFTDAFSFIDEGMAVVAVARSIKDIMAELKDLSEEERNELNSYFSALFDIPNDKVEKYIEDALLWGTITVRLVTGFKQLHNE